MNFRYIFAALLIMASNAHAENTNQSIKSTLEKINPNVKVLSISDSPIPDIKSVELEGNEYLYVTKDVDYIFSGQLLRREGNAVANLTELNLQKSRKETLSRIDVSKAITFSSNQESDKEIFVFTDVSCPYCRKFHNQISEYNKAGITVHYLAYPRAGTDSLPARAMAAAWCSEDAHSALTKALTNERDSVDTSPPENCNSPIEEDYQLGKKIGVAGTPGIYDSEGRHLGGYLSVEELKNVL